MKKVKINFLLIGFLAGVVYTAACGGLGETIAEAVGDAIDVMFDNSSSGLSATNMQEAVDELDGRVDNLEGSTLSTILVGTWTGSEFCNRCGTDSDGENSGISLTLNADGSYSCTTTDSSFSGIGSICDDPESWTVLKRTLKLTFSVTGSCSSSSSSSGSVSAACTPSTGTRIAVFPVSFVDADELELIVNDDDDGMGVLSLTKSS